MQKNYNNQFVKLTKMFANCILFSLNTIKYLNDANDTDKLKTKTTKNEFFFGYFIIKRCLENGGWRSKSCGNGLQNGSRDRHTRIWSDSLIDCDENFGTNCHIPGSTPK